MKPDLAKQLNPVIDTKGGENLFSVSLTGDQNIPINKRGSGTRRLILLNFFRAQAERRSENSKKNVIYAFEEPETSQHPDNQGLLVQTFEELAERSDCQVLFSTHTPMLARKINQNYLRYIEDENGIVAIHHGKNDDVMPKIVDSLGVLPDHNVKVFWGVEGKHDISFLTIISKILHNAGEDIPDLELAENEGKLIFVPFSGSSLDLWASRLSNFDRPEFYLVDGDDCPIGDHKYQDAIDKHKLNGHEVWITKKRELENYIHLDLIKSKFPNYPGQGKPDEKVPLLCSFPSQKVKYGVKKTLNNEVVSKMTPPLLNQVDNNDEVRGWLREIGKLL